MSKKNVLFCSLLYITLSGLLITLHFLFPDVCYTNIWCEENAETIIRILVALFLSVALVCLLCLVTYRMHDDVFMSWRKFAIWGVPTMTFLNLMLALQPTPGGLGIGSAYNGGLKLFVIFLLAATFTIISLLIIIWKYFSTRRTR